MLVLQLGITAGNIVVSFVVALIIIFLNALFLMISARLFKLKDIIARTGMMGGMPVMR